MSAFQLRRCQRALPDHSLYCSLLKRGMKFLGEAKEFEEISHQHDRIETVNVQ